MLGQLVLHSAWYNNWRLWRSGWRVEEVDDRDESEWPAIRAFAAAQVGVAPASTTKKRQNARHEHKGKGKRKVKLG